MASPTSGFVAFIELHPRDPDRYIGGCCREFVHLSGPGPWLAGFEDRVVKQAVQPAVLLSTKGYRLVRIENPEDLAVSGDEGDLQLCGDGHGDSHIEIMRPRVGRFEGERVPNVTLGELNGGWR